MTSKYDFKIISWNINGTDNGSKLQELLKLMGTNKP